MGCFSQVILAPSRLLFVRTGDPLFLRFSIMEEIVADTLGLGKASEAGQVWRFGNAKFVTIPALGGRILGNAL